MSEESNNMSKEELLCYIKHLVENKGVKYSFIADKAGISRTYMSLIINESMPLSDATYKKLLEVMKIY